MEIGRNKIYCHWETHGLPEPCSGENYPCPLKIAKETGKPSVVEHKHRDKLGAEKIFRIYGYPVFDESGELIQLIEYNVDITELKAKEEELFKLKLGIEKLEEAVFITDIDGKIDFVNQGFQKLYGYEPKEVLGKTPRILKSGKHPPKVYEKLWNTLLSKETFTGEIVNKTKDGKLITVAASASPIISDGEIIGFLAIQKDITEEVKAKKLLKEAKERAEAADAMKGRFLKQIYQEIEVPVKSSLKYGKLLLKYMSAEEDGEVNYILQNLQKNGIRIMRNTELVLNYAEIELGDYKPVIDYIDLFEEVILEVFQKLKPEAERKGLRFKINNEAENVSVQGDINSLRNIYLNLIDNAIKYTPEGSVEVTLFVKDGHVVSEVKDTGIGMSEEFMQNIFKPFSIDVYESNMTGGIGMGLALVKKYCEINNIKLEVESKKNKGSVFRLIFS